MSHAITDGHAGGSPASIAARYEILRTAALGAPLPVEARHGLGLFLRRGMWAWVRASVLAGEPARSARPFGSSATVPSEDRRVIQVFAAMAVNTRKRRAP